MDKKYREFEPQIKLMMAKEFPVLVGSQRTSESMKLFALASDYADELEVSNRDALGLR